MAKESPYGIDKRLIFRETFSSEAEVRRNGGTPVGVTFDKGVAAPTAIGSRIQYPNFLNGVYTIVISVKIVATSVNNRYLFGTIGGTQYIRIANGSPSLEVSSGTRYIGGVPNTNFSAFIGLNSFTQIVITGISLPSVKNWNISNYPAVNLSGTDVTFELFEIYSGTLTANEVKNLYENKRHKGLNVNHGEQLGSELMDQNAWYTRAYWTSQSDPNWTQVGNTLSSDGGSGYLTRANFWSTSKIYRITYTCTRTAGTLYALYGTVLPIGSTVSETVTRLYQPDAVNLNIRSAAFNGTITAMSIKEFFVPYTKEILNVSAVNGVVRNKYSGEVTNKEACTDPFFTDASKWDITSGWAVSGGVATGTNASNNIANLNILTIGKTYRVTFTIKTISSGDVTLRCGSTSYGTLRNSIGTYTQDLVCSGTDDLILDANNSFNGTISYFSAQEVIPSVVNTAVSVVKENDVYSMKAAGTSTSSIQVGSYDTLVGDKTFIFWYKEFTDTAYYQNIFGNEQLYILLNRISARIQLTSNNSTVAFAPNGSAYFKVKTWNMMIITRSSTGITNFYINGVAVGIANQSSGTPVAGSSITIFTRAGYWSNFYGDKFRIIDGILTPQEISQLYSEEKNKYGL